MLELKIWQARWIYVQRVYWRNKLKNKRNTKSTGNRSICKNSKNRETKHKRNTRFMYSNNTSSMLRHFRALHVTSPIHTMCGYYLPWNVSFRHYHNFTMKFTYDLYLLLKHNALFFSFSKADGWWGAGEHDHQRFSDIFSGGGWRVQGSHPCSGSFPCTAKQTGVCTNN